MFKKLEKNHLKFREAHSWVSDSLRARNKNKTAQLLLADKSFLLRLVGDQRSVGAAPKSQQKYLERGVRIKEIKEDRTASGGLFVDAKQCQVIL